MAITIAVAMGFLVKWVIVSVLLLVFFAGHVSPENTLTALIQYSKQMRIAYE